MAKLGTQTAEKAAEATSSFDPLEGGVYHARLTSVTVKPGTNDPYWSWEFEVIDDPYSGRRLWSNTSLSAAALWKLREQFDAFSATTDTDTDDLCGQICKLVVSQRVIQKGERKGELSNQVDKTLPADPAYLAAASTVNTNEDLF